MTSDKPYFNNYALMLPGTLMIAVTKPNTDMKSTADRKLSKNQILNGNEYKHWYIG